MFIINVGALQTAMHKKLTQTRRVGGQKGKMKLFIFCPAFPSFRFGDNPTEAFIMLYNFISAGIQDVV